jgi:hypothetical protein
VFGDAPALSRDFVRFDTPWAGERLACGYRLIGLEATEGCAYLRKSLTGLSKPPTIPRRTMSRVSPMADFTRTPLDAEALTGELQIFERRYRTPSSRLADAFTHAGQLVETDDFIRWNFVYSILNHRRGATRTDESGRAGWR